MTDRPYETEVTLRVRYSECDPMNVAHHAAYPVWLEVARTELLRAQGVPYRQMEARGVLFVVARMSVRYQQPALYDDVIRVSVRQAPLGDRRRQGSIKVDHDYTVRCGDNVLATALTTLVCVDRQGRPQPIPPGILAS